MAYIGKQPAIGNFVKLDAISVVNGQASYTMQNGGANFTEYSNVNQFLVSLNGILQSPTTSFTVSGSTITFASNLVTGDVIDHIIVLGNSLDVGVPSDNTVSLAKLTATGTKDATTFLRGDNTFAEAGGGIEMAENWRITANVTSDLAPISSNWEVVDTDGYGGIGTGMSQSSGIFTFPQTGIYLINSVAWIVANTGDGVVFGTYTTTDNSTYNLASSIINGDGLERVSSNQFIFDVTNTSTHKVRFHSSSVESGSYLRGETGFNTTNVMFVRLGDT